uniref:Uncharacterized protein n=1 Tax=Arundo donax TaxID=35708 RepID=A0A0A9B669_ARUDO
MNQPNGPKTHALTPNREAPDRLLGFSRSRILVPKQQQMHRHNKHRALSPHIQYSHIGRFWVVSSN